MSNNWVQDINDMHAKFGVHDWVAKKVAESDIETLRKYMQFRIDFLKEELLETAKAAGLQPALNKDNELVFMRSGADADPEEIVDGLIDLCVVAIGTLDAFGIDAYKAWDAVHTANMTKEPGVKPSRPNPLGLPDLIKPEGWTAPSHEGNHALISKL
jgi:predicted HAD superfamily Cof-like phosphohydrolase